MAEIDKEEYRFPDELEDEKLEIEIEDDTPEEDRNRKPPMPQEMIDKLETEEVDELEQYSDEAKKRINQIKKALHDERRAKEAAFREHQEAVELTKKLMQDKKRYEELIQSGEKTYVDTLQNSAAMEIREAKRLYKEAYESGDTDAMVDAQQALQMANLRALQAQNFKSPLQREENEVQIRNEPVERQVRPDNRAVAWQERNSWFGQDEEMTAAALGLHEKLKRNGVQVGSDEYYATLDKTIRKRFPEQFEEEPQAPKKSSTVVASATRSTPSNKVKLKTSQIQLAKKLGLTPEQYAIELRKLG